MIQPSQAESSVDHPRQRRCKIFFFAAAVCHVIGVASLLTNVQNGKGMHVVDTKSNHTLIDRHPQNERCVIHVHGLHHSGTGFTRQAVYNCLGGDDFASMHKNTRKPEDEGQFLQNVYPRLGVRRPELCGVTVAGMIGHVYYCPSLLRLANKADAKQRLHEQWSRYWNTSKPFLIQKTPTMDILFLEKMKILPTMHVIVMRHPFAWDSPLQQKHLPFVQTPHFLPTVWLDVWTHILEQLANGNIESYVVINYETLVLNYTAVLGELSHVIQSECDISVTPHQQEKPPISTFNGDKRTRRLHLYPNLDSSQYLVPHAKTLDVYNECIRDYGCRKLLNDAASTVLEFGYDFDPEAPFHGNQIILFSTSKPPPTLLVERMKELAAKYCSSRQKIANRNP